ncbi:Rne/Rng family ribonuclease [Rhodococcus sp. PAMC28707]|uniref:translation initiation factor IF-2 N-terminal domain-containing protein n=1 Tax=unclassified Rhodococcus (in: high G+C Gram-positive bacteria) TaxID=192944 RepID=UPI00109DE1B7|nr:MULTISPECIES: translation initiation factor IF-2 N-terminal domain-containing protein [unclassified Rhodococcus (in: high G+C Gram-positive bacteria)]QCB51681.1 Rne/Rng family ribonuclease [Rhodococcus sp. PAMC28705]QCB60151.1 Rne/Rng family ribonuclease [Rhodococcus sp. PAMC28707]
MADQAPPEDVQNSNSGSSVDDESSSSRSPAFPERLRVHALAKILGVTSKQVLAKLGELGIEARSAQSSLGRDVAETVYSSFAPATEAPPAPVETAAPIVVEPVPAVEAPTPVPAVEAPTVDSPPARPAFAIPVFLQPEAIVEAPKRRRSRKAAGPAAEPTSTPAVEEPSVLVADPVIEPDKAPVRGKPVVDAAPDAAADTTDISDTVDSSDTSEDADNSDDNDDQSQPRRRRRGRRGRGRGRGEQSGDGSSDDDSDDATEGDDDSSEDAASSSSDMHSSEDDAPVSGSAESDPTDSDVADAQSADSENSDSDSENEDKPAGERRSRRRSRSRSNVKSSDTDDAQKQASDTESEESVDSPVDSADDNDNDDEDSSDGSSRRRRRRRRRRSSTGDASSESTETEDDPPNTVVHEREPRNKSRSKDEVQGITGSTRLEAKRQRRRDGRDAGRRRPPILTESEFLARRESVDRVMVVREKSFPDNGVTTQVAVLEDGVLVEHFVTSSASASMVGNVYLGRVQNVLPSMEAAFIDIGRGRNGVLYAGEVNWDAAGLGGNSRKIEQALKPGDQVLVQVSKDPVGHKGARLTTQLSLAGRYLVYVPGGSSTGISRKLPDTERKRLKEILRDIVPPEAGVIIRTAAEGVSEDELARDVIRLQTQWATIEEASAKAETGKGSQPQALYEEPDLLVKVIRDLFNEDFVKLVIEGDKAWDTTSSYIETVAADMLPKLERHIAEPGRPDVFEAHRVDEQLAKALDRKVWLPSGGTLVIDRTEAMTVVDVNTGKFTGAGGNLEETVTRNNLEAAEEIVRQMRLRDIGGMIVVDFIDMVLESNRDLVLRRLTESLGRDRTRHQVSEVTSLGLVQMTRKKMGTGLIEAFSTTCEHCQGRGIMVHPYPVEAKTDDGSRSSSPRSESSTPRKRRGRDKSDNDKTDNVADATNSPAPKSQPDAHEHTPDLSVKRAHPVALAMAAHHDDVVDDVTPAEVLDAHSESSTSSEPKIIDAAEVARVRGGDTQSASTGSVATEVQPDSTVTGAAVEKAADPAVSEESPEPVVKARRGRRVARKSAAPTAETPDAAAVFVIPATHEEPAAPPEPSVTTVVEPMSSAPTTDEVPVKKPRRRRAAARPAGPPVDAE